MANDQTLLETISNIIEQDVAKIAKRASKEQLDRTSASNLVDYAKVQIALDRHQKQLEEQAEQAKIDASTYEELRAKAEAIIKGGR